MFVIGAALTIIGYIGTLDATYDLSENPELSAFAGLFIFAVGTFILFLSIQKKVHKDAFIEIKQKVVQQTEFQTIFDELDESIVILNESKKIVQYNKKYRKFIFAIFGESITTKVEEYTKLYERFENEKNEDI